MVVCIQRARREVQLDRQTLVAADLFITMQQATGTYNMSTGRSRAVIQSARAM